MASLIRTPVSQSTLRKSGPVHSRDLDMFVSFPCCQAVGHPTTEMLGHMCSCQDDPDLGLDLLPWLYNGLIDLVKRHHHLRVFAVKK